MPRVHSVPNLALLLFLAAPAAAQYGGGSPPAPPPTGADQSGSAAAEPAPPAEVIRAAACSIARDAAPAVALLGTTPFSSAERTQAASFVRGAQRCLRLRDQLATSAMVLRAAVAEALFEAQFATPAVARAPVMGASPLVRPTGGIAATAIQQLEPMYAIADCAAPRQPELVRAVLATEPRSPAEGTALTALHPAFRTCVTTGTSLSYDPRFMRGFLAEALYRWSVVQRDGAASPWAAAPAAAAPAGQ